jgi:hypothetical protein
LGLDIEKEDLIKSKELKNRGNSNLNVEGLFLIHVKVKIEQGQGSKSGLDVEGEGQIKNKELIKQVVAIPTPRLDVRIEIIHQIYVERYKKY